MKRTILATIFLTAATYGFAQTGTAPVSKAAFEQSVTRLKTAIQENKPELTSQYWEEMHKLMLAEFALLKQKTHDAATESDKRHYAETLNTQYRLYQDVYKEKQHLLPYKPELFTKIEAYKNAML